MTLSSDDCSLKTRLCTPSMVETSFQQRISQETPVVAALEVGALDGGGQHALVGQQWLVARVVAAEVEDGRQDIADLAEEIFILIVPAVVPFGPPVVLDIEVHLVVPVNLQVEVHDRQVDDHIFALIEMQLGLALARV